MAALSYPWMCNSNETNNLYFIELTFTLNKDTRWWQQMVCCDEAGAGGFSGTWNSYKEHLANSAQCPLYSLLCLISHKCCESQMLCAWSNPVVIITYEGTNNHHPYFMHLWDCIEHEASSDINKTSNVHNEPWLAGVLFPCLIILSSYGQGI